MTKQKPTNLTQTDVSEKTKTQIDYIKKNCPASICNTQFIKHLKGEKLTPVNMILAKCSSCTNQFEDGRYDCNIPLCPLYPMMPYKNKKEQR